MKYKIIYFVIFISIFSCKSTSTPMKPCMIIVYSLSNTIDGNIKVGNFNANPLIVKNGKALGLLNELDRKSLDTTFIRGGNKSIVFKNTNYFIDLYGKKAEGGVLFYRIEDYIKEENPNNIYLVNGVQSEYKKFKKAIKKKKAKINYVVTDVFINETEKANIINVRLLNK